MLESAGNRYSGMQITERNYRNPLRPRRFELFDFSTLLTSFFPGITLINYASSYRKMELRPTNNARD